MMIQQYTFGSTARNELTRVQNVVGLDCDRRQLVQSNADKTLMKNPKIQH